MYYNVSERLRLDSLSKLNDVCDTFVVGSDQLWNYGLSRPYKQMYFLGFADDSKKKIAYGTSFGPVHIMLLKMKKYAVAEILLVSMVFP